MKTDFHINTELIIDLIQGALEEEGHETRRYANSNEYFTTGYDCIVIKGKDGNYYELQISELKDTINPYTGKVTEAREKFERLGRWS